ncbi:MAG: hypothetical protein ABL959_00515 [Pyrinomonadaceae bacterium]
MARVHRAWMELLFVVIIATSSAAHVIAKDRAPEVEVGNVEQLYAAVNSTSNVGAILNLAPGVYLLSASAPGGAARPNGGRIELQENMSINGISGDRTQVIIDAINLPASSYTGTGVPLTGAIRMGRGRNAVRWLTIRNATVGSAGIETDIIFPGTAFIEISNIASTGNIRGVDIRNLGVAASGAIIEADILNNEFFNNTFGLSEGIRIGNFQGAVGAQVNARMYGNQSRGNQVGRLIVNNRAINSSVNVMSVENRFFDNGAGTTVVGGLSSNATVANGNTIEFESIRDEYRTNTIFGEFDKGGLVIVGGENTSITGGTNNNTVNVRLWMCILNGNQLSDLQAIGARSAPVSLGSPGIQNRVNIRRFMDRSNSLVESFTSSVPGDTDNGNEVIVFPS